MEAFFIFLEIIIIITARKTTIIVWFRNKDFKKEYCVLILLNLDVHDFPSIKNPSASGSHVVYILVFQ